MQKQRRPRIPPRLLSWSQELLYLCLHLYLYLYLCTCMWMGLGLGA